MCPSRALKNRVSGFKVLTYSLPHVSESQSKGFKAEKLLRPIRSERPKDSRISTPHPSACLSAAGMRVYQDEGQQAADAGACAPLAESVSSTHEGVLSQEEVDALLLLVMDKP
jgi:hypothetical protein